MRHEGVRVVVSTQSPLTMPPELLELSTVVACHGFFSQDWYAYLQKKLPLPEGGFDEVRNLPAGHALVFSKRIVLEATAANAADDEDGIDDADFVGHDQRAGPRGVAAAMILNIRPRITKDLCASRENERSHIPYA